MPQLHLTLFGSLQVTIGEHLVERLRSLREAALLAYLAIEADHPHGRTHLAGLLWPDLPESNARNNLKQTLLNLRETLSDREVQPSYLEANRMTIQFNRASPQWVDALVFGDALKVTAQHAHADLLTCVECQARLGQAVALYQGPLLANFSLPHSDLFEEWLLLTREQFHNQAVVACGQLSAIYRQQGNYPEALAYLRRQTQLDPFHEPAQRQLFELLAASGERSAALIHFDQFSTRLRNELGVEPSTETLALIEQIRTGSGAAVSSSAPPAPGIEPASAPAPATNRPAPTQQDWGGTAPNPLFVGRTGEETQVREWLQAGVRVITILGLAGVGKTALAHAVAHSQSQAFNVIIWRSLVHTPPLASLLLDWLTLLTSQPLSQLPQTLDRQLALLFEQLRHQRVLLVLDHVESVMQGDQAGRFRPADQDYGQFIQRIAQGEHQSVLLLTSREEPQILIQLAEETPAIRTLLLTGLSAAAAAQLLTAYGLAVEPALAAQLTQRFSGNPGILKFAVQTIQELLDGDVAAFLAEKNIFYGYIRDVFEEYRARVSYVEGAILIWLSIACAPLPLPKLRAALVPAVSTSSFLEAIHSLLRRGLLEQAPTGFTTPLVVMNGMSNFMLELLHQEILAGKPGQALHEVALFDLQATAAVQQSQLAVLTMPLVERLQQTFSPAGLIARLAQMSADAQREPATTRNYLLENLNTLLTYVTPASPAVMSSAQQTSLALPAVANVFAGSIATGQGEALVTQAEQQASKPPMAESTWHASGQAQSDKLRAAAQQPLVPSFLPAALTPIIGREQELAEIRERLQQPAVRLLTLVGAGGMGKTTLALAIGQALVAAANQDQLRQKYTDGIFFVALAPLMNSAALPSAIMSTMGLSLQTGDPHQALFQQIRHKHLLLILDNIEHLLYEGSGLHALVTLLQTAPGVQLLTTSRERLNLRDEHLYHVQPLTVAEPRSLADVAAVPAIRLFIQSAQQNAGDFTLTAANLPHVLRICRLVQGMPLGLELAAAHVGLLPLVDIANEIERSTEFLTVDWQDVPERQRSMRAVFTWSWQLLTVAEQRTLCRIAIFRGGFTREAAQHIAGASLPALMSLMRKSLLQRAEVGTGDERFQMHELLRQFAAEQLTDTAELAAMAARHSHFYLTFVASRAQRLARREPLQASAEIQAEIDNIRQAWTWAAQHGAITALDQAAYGWWQFCLFRGLGAEGKRTFALAVDGVRRQLANGGEDPAARQNGEQALSKLLAIHANYLFAQGQDELMAAEAREAIALGAASGGVEGETLGTFVLGRVLQEQNLRHESGAAWEKTIALAQAYQTGLPASEFLYEAEWMALNWLRGYALHFDDFASSQAYIDQALQLCQTLGKQRGELFCSADRAWLHFFRCDFAAASQGFSATLHLADALDYAWGEMMAQQGLGEMMRLNGEYGAAQTLLSQALKLATAIGDQYEEIMSLCRLLRLHAYLGDHERSEGIYQRLVQTLMDVRLPKECHLNSLLAFSLRALYREEYASALTYAQQAQQIVQTGDLLSRRADAAAILGHAQVAMQQWANATASYQTAIACYTQLGNAVLAVEAQAGLAQIALAQDDLAQAQQGVERVLPILAEQPRAGFTTPFAIYLTSYCVLSANQDARAAALIAVADKLLQEYAASLHDEQWRTTFLEQVTTHRQIRQIRMKLADSGVSEALGLMM